MNLIGEHTDYNDGFVMPAAIDRYTWTTITPRTDRKLQLRSEDFDEDVEIDLDDPNIAPRRHWSDYPAGVAVMLERSGYRLHGARLVIRSDVPVGSGLSSSAALEVATACALTAIAGLDIDKRELAHICRRAENEFVGARVGVMDQFASLFGESQQALLLDCRSLNFRLLPLPDNVRLLICNTMVKHALASSAYNERRAQCEAGVSLLAKHWPDVTALRDAGIEQLEQVKHELPEIVYRRCRHVITENARVLAAAEALEHDDLDQLGRLIAESHRSLRDDFEVSSIELDLMVEVANRIEGVYGARMTGGGFGGCTVNLVAENRVDEFRERVTQWYEEARKTKPEIYVCVAANGASGQD